MSFLESEFFILSWILVLIFATLRVILYRRDAGARADPHRDGGEEVYGSIHRDRLDVLES
jgi:hypothetical protein